MGPSEVNNVFVHLEACPLEKSVYSSDGSHVWLIDSSRRHLPHWLDATEKGLLPWLPSRSLLSTSDRQTPQMAVLYEVSFQRLPPTEPTVHGSFQLERESWERGGQPTVSLAPSFAEVWLALPSVGSVKQYSSGFVSLGAAAVQPAPSVQPFPLLSPENSVRVVALHDSVRCGCLGAGATCLFASQPQKASSERHLAQVQLSLMSRKSVVSHNFRHSR